MRTINEELENYVFDKNTLFYKYYRGSVGWELDDNEKKNIARLYEKSFRRFFRSLNPEVRLYAIEELSKQIFAVRHAWPELAFFRKIVLNRELTENMRYEKYRDHTFHSFIAFILGAFLYENSKEFFTCCRSSLVKENYLYYLRFLKNCNVEEPIRIANFACIMQDLFLSVFFHDIGYIFEGFFNPNNPWANSGDLSKAGMAISDFFLRELPRQYLDGNIKFAHRLYSLFPPPIIDTSSIASAGSALRQIKTIKRDVADSLEIIDAFHTFREKAGIVDTHKDRWRVIIDSMEHAFERILWSGIPEKGIRVLDHGIVTGLLILQLSTYFYELNKILQDEVKFKIDDEIKEALNNNFYNILQEAKEELTDEQYFSSVRRISGAAFHNLNPSWFESWKKIDVPDWGKPSNPFPLDQSTDGIFYIPILLDILQDWDRPSFPANYETPTIDGLDIYCQKIRGPRRVKLTFKVENKTNYINNLKSELSQRLKNWEDMVIVE